MQNLLQSIEKLYEEWSGKSASSIDVLPQSGSERRYFRIHTGDGNTIMATHGANIKENETFFYFSNHFPAICNKKIGTLPYLKPGDHFLVVQR